MPVNMVANGEHKRGRIPRFNGPTPRFLPKNSHAHAVTRHAQKWHNLPGAHAPRVFADFGRTWADFGLFAAFALSSDYCFWSFFDHNDKSSVATHPMDQVDPVKSQNGLFETL